MRAWLSRAYGISVRVKQAPKKGFSNDFRLRVRTNPFTGEKELTFYVIDDDLAPFFISHEIAHYIQAEYKFPDRLRKVNFSLPFKQHTKTSWINELEVFAIQLVLSEYFIPYEPWLLYRIDYAAFYPKMLVRDSASLLEEKKKEWKERLALT